VTGEDARDLEAFRGGSSEAFARLSARYAALVFSACLRRLNSREDAEDASQAVFLVLARHARSVQAQHLASWLHRTAVRAASVAARSRARRARHEEEAAQMRPTTATPPPPEWAEARRHLDAELDALPAKLREAVGRQFLVGQSRAEIARELAVPEGTVASRVAAGLERLRERLSRRGAGLSAAALGAALASEAQAAVPASLLPSIVAASKGAAVAGNAAALAKGVLKMMFWAKVKLAAAVIGGALAVTGGGGAVVVKLAAAEPAAAQPAEKPKLPINPQVAAMGDNTWIKLPTPQVHPICRSGSPWMPYVPEAGVGILWGCSASGYHNDLWTYNLALNEWKEMLKTEPSYQQDPDVFKFKDGVLMTREERPVPSHQWGRMDYDPDRQILWHLSQGMSSTLPGTQKLLDALKREGDPDKIKGKGPPLWKYEFKTNKWSMILTEDPTGCTRDQAPGFGRIRYYPPLRKLIMFPNIVSPNEAREKFKAYDPDTNRWEPLICPWKPLGDNFPKYWVWGTAPMVYDTKRQALVLILGGGGGTWLLGAVKKTCEQVVAGDKTPAANLDGPVGGFVYDSAAATTLTIFVSYTVYEGDKTMTARGFPIDRPNVWALDVEKKEWTLQPKPADGVLPPMNKKDCIHHFYDPVNNATMLFMGSYNGGDGEVWVYRYQKAAK
jgi:RNA polymerase sigma factor (sigma-70 family)